MTGVGLSPSETVPVASIATIDVGSEPLTDHWRALFDSQTFRDVVVRSIRAFAEGRTVLECYEVFEERGVPYYLRSPFISIARGDDQEAWRTVGQRLPRIPEYASTEDLFAVARFIADEHPVSETGNPPIAFVISREFEAAERRKRERVCRLIATLAQGFDVRYVATGRAQLWARAEHRDDLPGVSEWRTDPRDGGPLTKVVDRGVADLEHDGRDLRVLRTLFDEPTGTLAYNDLYGTFPEVSASRVRQCIDRLVDLELVTTFGPQQDRKVELREAGRRVVETFDVEIGRQRRLDDRVSETRKSRPQCRVTTRTGGEGQQGRRPYEVGWLDRANHAAATACGRDGGVVLANGRLPDGDGRTHGVSYDDEDAEAVVAVEASEPLPYAVSTAVALAYPPLIERTLTDERLEAIEEPPAILRDGRCIGALSDDALEVPDKLRSAFVEWGLFLQDLTRELHNGEYDDRDAFRSAIMRSAHGLAGSIAHLFDAIGVDLTRELRVPRGADREDLEDLVESIWYTMSIQSQYNSRSCYRQLFEDRPGKREGSFGVEVDAADPRGSFIGSLVIRSPSTDRLRPLLEEHLQDGDIHDDAPEFIIDVPIRETSRSDHAAVANRILFPKRLQPTEAAISLCQAFVPDPYAAARALQQLSPEDRPREIRPDELRYALATLDAEDILPDHPSTTISKTLATLLAVDEPLTQDELADRAGVSPRSIRDHRADLEAIGLLEVDASGYRLAVSFCIGEERRDPVLPEPLETEWYGTADVLDPLLLQRLPPDRYGDPDDPVGGALFGPTTWQLVGKAGWEPWAQIAGVLAGEDPPGATPETIRMGPTLEQTALTDSTEATV